MTLKAEFIRTAASRFGATGWNILNEAGDRKISDYDLYAVRLNGTTYEWYISANYNGSFGILTVNQ